MNISFNEFLNALYDAGWKDTGDAQWEGATKLHQQWFSEPQAIPAVTVPEFTDAAWNTMSEAMDSQGYSATKNDMDRDDYKALFDAALQSANSSPRITEQDCPTYDLDKMAWESIKLAANESGWIPQEYCMNDWVSDVCSFLRNCRSDRVTKQDARVIVESAIHHYIFKKHSSNIDNWLTEEGYALLNKLNAKPEQEQTK